MNLKKNKVFTDCTIEPLTNINFRCVWLELSSLSVLHLLEAAQNTRNAYD